MVRRYPWKLALAFTLQWTVRVELVASLAAVWVSDVTGNGTEGK